MERNKYKIIAPFFLLWMLLTGLSSCDCFIHGGGYIVDRNTKQPLNNVRVHYRYRAPSDVERTDSAGHFEYNIISGGFCSCRLRFDAHKEGYRDKDFRFNSMVNDTIFLEKEQ